MTSDAMLVLKTLFNTIWRLFTSWYIPGTNTTPGAFIFFLLFAVLGLRVIRTLILGAVALHDPDKPRVLTVGGGGYRRK